MDLNKRGGNDYSLVFVKVECAVNYCSLEFQFVLQNEKVLKLFGDLHESKSSLQPSVW